MVESEGLCPLCAASALCQGGPEKKERGNLIKITKTIK